jgi:hypothetical protein
MRIRVLLALVLTLLVATATPSDAAIGGGTPRTVYVRGLNGAIMPAGIVTVQVCAVLTGECSENKPVGASGEISIGLDDGSYTVSAAGYRAYVSTPVSFVDGTVINLPIGPPRTISGEVTVNSRHEPYTGIFACATDRPCNAATAVAAFGDGSTGIAQIAVSSTSSYIAFWAANNFATWLQAPGPIAPFGVYPPGTGPLDIGVHDFLLPRTEFSGTVSRTGFTTFAPNTAGVGACPVINGDVPPPQAGERYCHDLRFSFADSNGSYLLPLPATVGDLPGFTGLWRMGAFVIVDGVPVLGVSEDIQVSGTGAVSKSFSADDAVTPAPVLQVTTPGASAPITVATSDGSNLTNVVSAPASSIVTPTPTDVSFTYGVQSFTAGPLPSLGATVSVTLTLPGDTLPVNAKWYKLEHTPAGPAWVALPDCASSTTSVACAQRTGDHTMKITIIDGKPGDDDGVQNGYVTDPGGVGLPKAPTSAAACKSNGWRDGPYKNQGQCVSAFATTR